MLHIYSSHPDAIASTFTHVCERADKADALETLRSYARGWPYLEWSLQGNGRTIAHIPAPQFNADAHARAWYDEPATEHPGKFQGERRAVAVAHETSLNGCSESFGESEGFGFYGRVLFDDAPFLVCFREDSNGFVTEITNEQYEAADAEYIELHSEDEDYGW